MKKLFLLIALAVAGCLGINAESNIYVFIKSVGNSDIHILVDGKEVADINGPVKKVMQPGWGLEYPLTMLESCYRKIVVPEEGKVVVSMEGTYKNAMNGNVSNYKAEFPLDLEDGESYYLEVTNKGLSDVKFKEIKEKDALKKMKKWVELPTVTVE